MIGNIIRNILLQDAQITTIVGKEIHPIKVHADRLPAICYRVTYHPTYQKRRSGNLEYSIELVTFCNSYKESWELSLLIKEALEDARRETIEDKTLVEVRCSQIEDDYEYNIDTYGQRINFKVEVV